MTPALITAIAYLLTEALVQGVEITKIMTEVKSTGKISDELWESIINDLTKAQAGWDAAPGPVE